MKVTPVVDIKGGVVVGAVSGIREKYLPLSSGICDSSDPVEVCRAFMDFGFESVYVADLDGIVERKPNLDLIKRIIADVELHVLLDVGVESREDVFPHDDVTPVLGSESLSSPQLLDELAGEGVEFIASIDVKDGALLNKLGLNLSDFLGLLDGKLPKDYEVILLDLSCVGTLSGPNTNLIKKVKAKLRNKKIIYGGGVRDLEDVKKLHKEGIRHVLLGSSIHSERFSRKDLEAAQSL
ncbi:MAG: HisA/HisF-related TIM barrel protein [Candidatus Altiarchaeota archaeon]